MLVQMALSYSFSHMCVIHQCDTLLNSLCVLTDLSIFVYALGF